MWPASLMQACQHEPVHVYSIADHVAEYAIKCQHFLLMHIPWFASKSQIQQQAAIHIPETHKPVDQQCKSFIFCYKPLKAWQKPEAS